MKADLLVLDALAPSLRPIVDGFGIVAHSAVGANVSSVVVDGRVVLEAGRSTRFDDREVIGAAQAVPDRLWRESGWTPALGGGGA